MLFLMEISGEIKVVEKLDMDEMQADQNSLDFKMSGGGGSGGLHDISSGMQRKPQPSQGLVAIPVSNAGMDHKAASLDKNVIAVLPGNVDLLDGDATTLINVDRINNIEELDEIGLMRVKQELCEVKKLVSCLILE